jgi:hypothetical protein
MYLLVDICYYTKLFPYNFFGTLYWLLQVIILDQKQCILLASFMNRFK